MANNQTIDTLQLDIVVNSNKATSNLKNTTTQVDKLTRTMSTYKDGVLQTESTYKKVGNSIEQVITKYNKLGEVISTITKSGITQKEVAPKIATPKIPEDFTKTYKNIVDGATKSETVYSRIAGEIKKVTTYYNDENLAIKRVSEEVDKLGNKTISTQNLEQKEVQETKNWYQRLFDTIKSGSGKQGSGLLKSLNFGAMIGKLYFIRNITKRLSDTLANVVQYGIDFTETLNLWQTAMRGNVGEARTFISEMNKAYGIAEATLMKYQATFKNMLSAMGKISEDTAYGLSEALTNMALDFASLYNVSIENAMTKFQAVLSRQVRPIRSISGYDITENTIFDLYKSLGGTKTMRQLNQTEKSLLSIYAVYTQMNETGALGDMQKTLYTNANQLRIMKEQAIEVATWFGNAFSYLIQESGVLVTINSYLFTAKELAKSLAYELGYREENFMTGFADSAEDANEEVDKLTKKLFSFDKFESLKSGEDTDISIESALTNPLKNYNSILSGVTNPAQEKSVELLKQMGYELKTITNEETGETTQIWEAKDGNESLLTKIKEIGSALGIIGIIILSITSPVLAVIGAIEYLNLTSDEFNVILKEIFAKVQELIPYLIETVNNIIPIIVLFEPILMSILDLLVPIFDIVNALMPIINDIIIVLLDLLMPIIQPILEGIVYNLKFIASLLRGDFKGALENASGFFKSFGNIAIGVGNAIIKVYNAVNDVIIDGINVLIRGLNKIKFDIPKWIPFIGGNTWGFNINEISKANSRFPLIPTFAKGGGFDTADLFYANENGSTELVASSNNGGAVMNMKQLESAIYSGMMKAFSQTSGDTTAKVEVTTKGDNALFDLITDKVVVKMKQRSII